MEFFEVGTVLYLYTIRTGTLKVHKGTVGVNNRTWWRGRDVTFTSKTNKDRCPTIEDIGVIQTGGPRVWLTERDDEKARALFIEYEKDKLAELEATVEKKKALIKMLESVGMES